MSTPGAPPASVHGTCVLVGASGVLLRGASGAGKSRVADLLVSAARGRGRFAAHVADDRVVVRTGAGRLLARAPEALAGLWERRGEGIVPIVAERAAVLRLVVDLLPAQDIERLPPPDDLSAEILGIRLARLVFPASDPAGVALTILSRL